MKTPFEFNVQAILLNAICLFIYSHEVGHAILGHCPLDGLETQEQMWRKEFEADHFAMIHLDLHCSQSKAPGILTLLGPIIFFKYLEFFEHYRLGISSIESHPPASQRAEKYLQWLRARVPNNEIQNMTAMLQLEDDISRELGLVFAFRSECQI